MFGLKPHLVRAESSDSRPTRVNLAAGSRPATLRASSDSPQLLSPPGDDHLGDHDFNRSLMLGEIFRPRASQNLRKFAISFHKVAH